MSKRLILAFDVGTRNLGVCLLNDYAVKYKVNIPLPPPTLVIWKTFDLYDGEVKSKKQQSAEPAHKLAQRLYAFLDNLDARCAPFVPSLWSELKMIGIESQAVSTMVMKRLESYLLSYFLLRCPHLTSGKVKVISATAKLRIKGMQHTKADVATYDERKRMAISYMQAFVQMYTDVDDDTPLLKRSDADRCDASLLALSLTQFSFWLESTIGGQA